MATARSAVRILAATGPLDMPTLLNALTRARRWKGPSNLTAELLADALMAVAATQDANGRWHAPPGFPAPDRYRVIIAAGAGRDLTRQEVIDILTAAGYTASSADGLMSSTHPLFVHVGRNRYRVLTSPEGKGTVDRCRDRARGRPWTSSVVRVVQVIGVLGVCPLVLAFPEQMQPTHHLAAVCPDGINVRHHPMLMPASSSANVGCNVADHSHACPYRIPPPLRSSTTEAPHGHHQSQELARLLHRRAGRTHRL